MTPIPSLVQIMQMISVESSWVESSRNGFYLTVATQEVDMEQTFYRCSAVPIDLPDIFNQCKEKNDVPAVSLI